MNRLVMRHRDLHGDSTVSSFDYLVSLFLEILTGEIAQVRLVFHQENRFCSGLDSLEWNRCRDVCGRFFRGGDSWQVDLKRRPAAYFAVDPDVSAALLDDAVHRGEAEAGALRALGGEEGLEDV